MACKKLESAFQSKLIKKLKDRYPGCFVLKNDSGYIQGIPDLTVLYRRKWAALECKRSEKENRRPNQSYYVEAMNKMSYAAFIFPENEDEILGEMDAVFLED